MTEEIIINGVDISECNYAILPKKQCPMKSMPYAKETSCIACKEHNTRLNFCKNNPNCCFKQLKRTEQKLEKIKANCNETLSECSCKNPIIDIDCRECTSGGRVDKAKEILQIIEGEENDN